MISHPFKPIVFKDSKVLILGTFPSIKSIDNLFYYSHPNNQFWKILATIFNEEVPKTTSQKIEFLKKHKIALWDSICIAKRKKNNSSDSNIEIVKPCNIEELLKKYPNIQKVIVNSKKAQKVINDFFPSIKISYIPSPSTAYPLKLEKKVELWKKELLELM